MAYCLLYYQHTGKTKGSMAISDFERLLFRLSCFAMEYRVAYGKAAACSDLCSAALFRNIRTNVIAVTIVETIKTTTNSIGFSLAIAALIPSPNAAPMDQPKILA
jgi:hypothetical protein